jgi:cellulose synthase/poly-beta-1,6-N-acetylglucosamine synthase-like glycosyltransferase
MLDVITWIYLGYMFIALYFLFLFVLTFLQNRKEMFSFPELDRERTVSVLIPAYNEEESIRGTVESVLKIDYGNIVEIIIINDGSKDRTGEIGRELEEKYEKVKLLEKSNSGKADSLNQAIKIAKGELVTVVDADSYPSQNSLKQMTGYFQDEKVGGVTTRILVRNPKKFIQKLQAIEYKVIGFTRKLLGFLDAIYVTPGPLAVYRKSALEKVGGFDTQNMTEDIEITWHLVFEGFKTKMSFMPSVTTVAPDTFKKWFHQRNRWNIGGMQTMLKYKKYFLRKGMLGFFILPFFSVSLFLGVFGLGFFLYRISRNIFVNYLATKYSIAAQTAILRINDVNLNPSILHFFGVILFLTGLIFVYFAMYFVNQKTKTNENFWTILFYSLVYITVYPFILVSSVYRLIKKNYRW